MPWAVVEFLTSEEVEAVPRNWIIKHEDNLMCLWPPPKVHKLTDLIAREVDISELDGTTKYSIRILGENYETFAQARQKCIKAQKESELDSCGESEAERATRKRFAKTLFSPSNSPKKRKISDFSKLDSPNGPLLPPPTFVPNRNNSEIHHNGCSSSPKPTTHKEETSQVKRTHKLSSLDEEWKRKISNELAYLKLKLDAIYEVVVTLQASQSKTSDDIFEESEAASQNIDIICNPIENESHLENFEKKLQEKKTYDFVVKDLSRLGGTTTKEVTKRILRKLLSDKLAQHYSFHGFKKKKVFGTLKMKNVIFDAVRKTPSTTQSSDAEIEGVVKDWLRQAKFRLIAKNKTQYPVVQGVDEQVEDHQGGPSS
ncbi:uncharacterized protein LOC128985496 isoform X1 [Macrosteles quadrilineatus]|uniref:uncharacterized protein LOC128985496 isoform X1 n=1 Tax=Macrosteles quadrilineatus TaxID=74068 RepID=UPI0023E104B6|nr:uncharacterized protein LOC128985496 isoform X1 [Macrosteles quadrilineatus]